MSWAQFWPSLAPGESARVDAQWDRYSHADGCRADNSGQNARDARDCREALSLCESLSFTPWHTLPEQLPICGVQRAREPTHKTNSKLRYELTQQPRNPP